MEIAIIGGGIAGLALALNLDQRGLTCRVCEAVPEVKEFENGITLPPAARDARTGAARAPGNP